MSDYEIRLDGEAVSKDTAIEELAKAGGLPVRVYAQGESGPSASYVMVGARHRAYGKVQAPEVNWASGQGPAASARKRAAMINFAADLAEAADQR